MLSCYNDYIILITDTITAQTFEDLLTLAFGIGIEKIYIYINI